MERTADRRTLHFYDFHTFTPSEARPRPPSLILVSLGAKPHAMFDDLNAHFHEQVVTLYMRYRETREHSKAGVSKDLLAGVAAANALYLFREHLPASHMMSRADVAAQCPDYDLLGDIANASKHRELTRGTPKVTRAESMYEQVVVTEYSDEQGIFTDARKVVNVKLDDGTERELFDIVTNVINFWGNALAAWGILQSYKPFPAPLPPGSGAISRDAAHGMDLEMIRGVRFKMHMRLQRFNPAKGHAEPLDLTGCKLSFGIYEPKFVLDGGFIDARTGEKRTFSIPLTQEQVGAIEALQSDDEKQAFVRKLLSAGRERA